MKAHRAIVELGLLGISYLATGVIALVKADRMPRFGILAAVLGVLVAAGAIAMAVHRLNHLEGLPAAATRTSWPSVAARVLPAAALPVATIFLLPATGWILGLTFAVLGAAICATAVLASHVEHLCGARVWRSNHRFYFAR